RCPPGPGGAPAPLAAVQGDLHHDQPDPDQSRAGPRRIRCGRPPAAADRGHRQGARADRGRPQGARPYPGRGLSTLEVLHAHIRRCRRCPLWRTRTHAVPGEGPARADVMFVGEGPGKEEDRTGRPFVGRAGRVLDELLAGVGLRREDVYVTNVIKDRAATPGDPPRDRPPAPPEITACAPWLAAQLASISPRLVLPLARRAGAAPGVAPAAGARAASRAPSAASPAAPPSARAVPSKRSDGLQIIPIGGLGEIGKNSTLIRLGRDGLVVDAGLMFPDEEL